MKIIKNFLEREERKNNEAKADLEAARSNYKAAMKTLEDTQREFASMLEEETLKDAKAENKLQLAISEQAAHRQTDEEVFAEKIAAIKKRITDLRKKTESIENS